MAEERKVFKEYFDRQAAQTLADQVVRVWPKFDATRFIRLATRDLNQLEFQARVQQFAHALADTLPSDTSRALKLLTRSLPPLLPDCEAVTDGWLQWPVGQYIADHGLPHFEESMEAMTELTMRFSSEFAVRPFLIERPSETYARLYALTSHPNPHVRRWCSEGTRPRLPWGRRLVAAVQDPSPSWPILEALKDDPELYVRKSVANHLNDIAKDHADQVVMCCRRWMKGAPAPRKWIVRHALRTLIKAGHPDALALMGFAPLDGVEATLRIRPARVRIGDSVEMEAVVTNKGTSDQRIVLDYRVDYVRPSGKTSSKVFKWTTAEVSAGDRLLLRKKHPFRPTSIRSLHAGSHGILVQVNGIQMAVATVRVTE